MRKNNTKLPIGVLIPTRNAMAYLEQHLKGLQSWLHRVEEIIIVDSESTDGTLEYLSENLHHPSLRIMQHPPGLYESWNFGIQQITAQWLYIATVGDRINAACLEKLLTASKDSHSDVTISPPSIISPSGKALKMAWPIHTLLERYKIKHSRPITNEEAFFWNSLFLPGSLMGSSASNLYLTRYMQENPFESSYGHAGDIAWGINHSFSAKWAIVPDCYSEFIEHPSGIIVDKNEKREIKKRLILLARQQLQDSAGGLSSTSSIKLLEDYLQISIDALQNKTDMKALIDKQTKFYHPALLHQFIQQKLLSRKISAYRQQLLNRLSIK
ncbi:MAG: glycosyltransferase family A protein [Methylococcaceae bacterium]